MARSSEARLFDESFGAELDEEAPLQEPMPRAEQELEAELANICDRIGGSEWKPLLKAIHDWIAAATGAERLRRIEALERLINEIKIQFARIETLRQDWFVQATSAEPLRRIEPLDRFMHEIRIYCSRLDALCQELERRQEEAKWHIHHILRSLVEKFPA